MVAGLAVPDAVKLVPLEPVAVHVAVVPLGMVSLTVAPVTALGPALLTTIV